MSDKGKAILKWWSAELERDTAHGRRLAATLRRAGPVAAMSEPKVHELARELGIKDAEKLVRLVSLLAEVRENVPQTLAKVLGGHDPDLSQLRFQKLMRAEGDELINGLRRAIKIAGHRCNVAALGEDLMFWSDQTRMTWCFHYFGAEAPNQFSEETH
ncbi:type I-E CRISPR-associated protein Cse2/CasB [Yoonia sediminilitoris]|uniref:CRISPR system Cascade subunit CasB n=1 Tax=Yoonia sediminilitoris TaxID=1286148 RepID=A0A2T6K767_9RHOB|nr:type I-E CRISPR-associated protein Cse2/CasB [Yoonia sediminilitoris]PUB10536.1 CRISPR system Cascade subunit CasB [Yoonia sediminilitoris]RCW90084.1 CRISPR system Cascade subunit CasB [Yoonia sediminilitoris]